MITELTAKSLFPVGTKIVGTGKNPDSIGHTWTKGEDDKWSCPERSYSMLDKHMRWDIEHGFFKLMEDAG